MRKLESKSLRKEGEQSGGPEHKVKIAAPKISTLVIADPVRLKGKAIGFQEEMDKCTEIKPGVGIKALQKRLNRKSWESLVAEWPPAISVKSEMQEKT